MWSLITIKIKDFEELPRDMSGLMQLFEIQNIIDKEGDIFELKSSRFIGLSSPYL